MPSEQRLTIQCHEPFLAFYSELQSHTCLATALYLNIRSMAVTVSIRLACLSIFLMPHQCQSSDSHRISIVTVESAAGSANGLNSLSKGISAGVLNKMSSSMDRAKLMGSKVMPSFNKDRKAQARPDSRDIFVLLVLSSHLYVVHQHSAMRELVT